jgi:hypothetical protein
MSQVWSWKCASCHHVSGQFTIAAIYFISLCCENVIHDGSSGNLSGKSVQRECFWFFYLLVVFQIFTLDLKSSISNTTLLKSVIKCESILLYFILLLFVG